MELVFDTETTGLPNKRSPRLELQPHLMQLAFTLYDLNRRPVFELSTLVQLPKGVAPDPKAYEVHGISAEMCNDLGMKPATVFALLNFASERAVTTIAHNIEFDLKIIEFTGARLSETKVWSPPNPLCTCDAATEVLQLPPTEAMIKWGHGDKFKRANLDECFAFFFPDTERVNAHDAFVDVNDCARVYFELKDRGLLAK